jgi:hypothetical protein
MKLYFQIPDEVGYGLLFEHTKKQFASEQEIQDEFIYDYVKTFLGNEGVLDNDCCIATKNLRKKAKYCLECGSEIARKKNFSEFADSFQRIFETCYENIEEYCIDENKWRLVILTKEERITPVYFGNFELAVLDSLLRTAKNEIYSTFIPFIAELEKMKEENQNCNDEECDEEDEECDCEKCN